MKYLLYVALCLFVFAGCRQGLEASDEGQASPGGKVFSDVIYGADNRVDLYQVSDPLLLAAADSTVALVQASDLSLNSAGNFVLAGAQLGPDNSLCKSEPFYSQQTGAFCSGFLVEADTIVTAGHCIQDASDCSSTKFAFGFSIKSLSQKYNEFPKEDVVGCKSVVHTQHPNDDADFAIIKLDRPILNHMPLRLAQQKNLKVGDAVFVIGHPTGLPTKIAGGANVRSASEPGFFVANLDTYGGNSGSAVFNAQTLEVEGILVRGENDYVMSGDCRVSNHCTNEGCRGEDVTKISSVLPYLQGQGPGPDLPPETFSAQPNLAIPDNNSKGVATEINVNQTPQGRKVQIKINIQHTWVGDLILKLVSPDGKSYLLRSKTGGNQKNLVGIIGDTLPSASDLSALSSETAKGKWSLQIADVAARDVGQVVEWGVIFKP